MAGEAIEKAEMDYSTAMDMGQTIGQSLAAALAAELGERIGEHNMALSDIVAELQKMNENLDRIGTELETRGKRKDVYGNF